jgi:HK97 family phage major capsid protein
MLQDSSFDALTTVSNAVAMRYARGIGSANVSTLISQATSAVTTELADSVSVNNLLDLFGSIDPAYISSSKFYWAMNFSTLIYLFKLSATTGQKLVKPRVDTNGNWLLFEKPIAICPSFANIGANNVPIACGDFSKLIVRTVKGSMALKRYEQSIGLAENGLVAFEGFIRSSAGLLVASGADSPIKFLTCAAS